MIPSILATANTNGLSTPQPRLVRAAHEFEAQMMKELLKPMTESASITGEEDDEGSTGALGQYASESLARSLSDHGGLGIANQIIRDLSHSSNQKVTSPVTWD